MQAKSKCRTHSAILLTFIKLPFAIKTFVFTIFEWPLKTVFTVFVLQKGTHFAKDRLSERGVQVNFRQSRYPCKMALSEILNDNYIPSIYTDPK